MVLQKAHRTGWHRHLEVPVIVGLIVILVITAILLVPLPDRLHAESTGTVVLDRNGEILRVFLDDDQQWNLPQDPEHAVPEKLCRAAILQEDRRYYYHSGVDPLAVVRAAVQNIRSGRVASGASTITMQLARILQPKARTLPNKILETIQAIKLELLHSKKEILLLYLDRAPFGGNIVGYRAAALKYFGKQGHAITWAQAAMLAVLPNDPGRIGGGMNVEALRTKRNNLLRKLEAGGEISDSTLRSALREPVPESILPAPLHAPHLARRVRDLHGPGWIRTTIDHAIQEHAELLVHRHSEILSGKGIRHAAALIVETRTGKVRAYIGSPDFFDPNHGQVDGIQAPRSSGSILKPFLYALAMDDGLITPVTKLLDIPTRYGTFVPANADESFGGLVTVSEALTQSLNVPAVRLLNAFGIRSAHQFFREAGLTTLFRNPAEYGLPLVLGGCEVTLWDMATLYRGLADGGRFSTLHVLDNPKPDQPVKQLISPGAGWLTLEILRNLDRPGAHHYWHMFENERPVAWKTGTSYGRRDAWAIGVSPDWTIAVWCGNFDGTGNPGLGGAETAGPLLFDLFRIMPGLSRDPWFAEPVSAFRTISVCEETGYPAGPACEKTVQIRVPRDARFRKTCPWHQHIQVDRNGTHTVCSRCWKPGRHHTISCLVYPPDVVQLLADRGVQLAVMPPHNPSCPAVRQQNLVSIVYPDDDTTITLPRDFGGRKQAITCRAAAAHTGHILFWYLDGSYLGMTRDRHEFMIQPVPGIHRLTVVDRIGNRSTRRFRVTR